MPVAATYAAAIDLVVRHGSDNSKIFEVNADGSIRTQNWREKLGNLGARITRNYQLHKDTKDAAVAAALERLAQSALNGIDQDAKNIVAYQQQFPADVLTRFHQARDRLAQRNTPRNVDIRAASNNPADQNAVASLHQQGANNGVNYGATAQVSQATTPATSPASSAVNATAASPAGPAPIDLAALARKYQVNPKIAKFLVGGGPEFGKVIRALLSEPKFKSAQWGAPFDQKYATLLNKTYEQELVYAVAAGKTIEDHQILAWAVASLKQVQES